MRAKGHAAVALLALTIAGLGASAEISTTSLETRLNQASASLGGGYTRLGKARTGGLGDGQATTFEYLLKAGVCYRFMAVGGEAVEDLDLRIYSGGSLLAQDTGAVPRPVVQHCAAADARVEVRLQMFKGHGQYAFAVFVKGGSEDKASAGSLDAVLADLEATRQAMAPDSEPVGQPRVGQLGHRETETVPFELGEARCVKILAVGGPGVTDLNLRVFADGDEVGSDRISGQKPVVEWCSPGRATIDVKLSMYGGAGVYAVGVYGVRADAARATDKVGGAENDFVANRIRQLHAQFGRGRAAVSPVLRGNLSVNNEQVFKIRLVAGHCYTIIGAGAPSVRDMDLVLMDRGREIQSDTTSNGFPTLDTAPCPTFTGEHVLKVRMRSGFGQFGVQVFSD